MDPRLRGDDGFRVADAYRIRTGCGAQTLIDFVIASEAIQKASGKNGLFCRCAPRNGEKEVSRHDRA